MEETETPQNGIENYSQEQGEDSERDLSIPTMIQESIRDLVAKNSENMTASNQHIESAQNFWADLPDEGQGDEVFVSQYLAAHPEIINEQRLLSRDINGVFFDQVVSESSENERGLIKNMRELCGGQFAEIMVLLGIKNDGSIDKRFAFSGSGDEVTQEAMAQQLQAMLGESSADNLTKILLIHTHPDLLAKSKLKSQRDDSETVGFVSTNALTDRDITTADTVQQKMFPSTPVFMVAISENGLSYRYKAGTSHTNNQTSGSVAQ